MVIEYSEINADRQLIQEKIAKYARSNMKGTQKKIKNRNQMFQTPKVLFKNIEQTSNLKGMYILRCFMRMETIQAQQLQNIHQDLLKTFLPR